VILLLDGLTRSHISNACSNYGSIGSMSSRRHDPRRIDQDLADQRQLKECAAALRTETSQARYTNQRLEPYPLFSLTEFFEVIGREVSAGALEPRNPIRRHALTLAGQFRSIITETP
jgi:hypothetical protein